MRLYRETLSRSGFRYTEKILYERKTYDTAIKQLEADLNNALEEITELQAVKIDDEPHGTGQGSPIETYVMRRDSPHIKYLKNRIEEMKRYQKGIEQAMAYMTDTEKLLIKLFYDREKTARQCYIEMCMSRSSWYRLRQQIVYNVASFLGIY
jgi:DNA-directed RNA polymerase specialized sigma subunit